MIGTSASPESSTSTEPQSTSSVVKGKKRKHPAAAYVIAANIDSELKQLSSQAPAAEDPYYYGISAAALMRPIERQQLGIIKHNIDNLVFEVEYGAASMSSNERFAQSPNLVIQYPLLLQVFLYYRAWQ